MQRKAIEYCQLVRDGGRSANPKRKVQFAGLYSLVMMSKAVECNHTHTWIGNTHDEKFTQYLRNHQSTVPPRWCATRRLHKKFTACQSGFFPNLPREN